MDPIGVAGLVVSVVGAVLSIFALVQAKRASTAVAEVIGKSHVQAARDEARALLALVTDAREAAMAWRRNASRLSSAGRSSARDLLALQQAQNALATTTIGSTDAGLTVTLRTAAAQIDQALVAIGLKGERDGWADALGVLQGVTPTIDLLQRELGGRALR